MLEVSGRLRDELYEPIRRGGCSRPPLRAGATSDEAAVARHSRPIRTDDCKSIDPSTYRNAGAYEVVASVDGERSWQERCSSWRKGATSLQTSRRSPTELQSISERTGGRAFLGRRVRCRALAELAATTRRAVGPGIQAATFESLVRVPDDRACSVRLGSFDGAGDGDRRTFGRRSLSVSATCLDIYSRPN